MYGVVSNGLGFNDICQFCTMTWGVSKIDCGYHVLCSLLVARTRYPGSTHDSRDGWRGLGFLEQYLLVLLASVVYG